MLDYFLFKKKRSQKYLNLLYTKFQIPKGKKNLKVFLNSSIDLFIGMQFKMNTRLHYIL